MSQEEKIETMDALLARAVKRGQDRKAATERLLKACVAAAAPIGRAAEESGISVSLQIGTNLDGKAGYDYEPLPFLLEAVRYGSVYVGEAALARDCMGYSARVSAETFASSWWLGSYAEMPNGWKQPPRHILIIVASRLGDLASALAEKAEKLAAETEAAVAMAEALPHD